MATTSICVPKVSSSGLLPLLETLQGQQVGVIRNPIKLLFLPWLLEPVNFCMCSFIGTSISHSPLGLLEVSPGLAGLQAKHCGDHLPGAGPWGEGS